MSPDVCAEMDDRAEGIDRCGGFDWSHLCYWFQHDTPWPEVVAYTDALQAAGTCQEVA